MMRSSVVMCKQLARAAIIKPTMWILMLEFLRTLPN